MLMLLLQTLKEETLVSLRIVYGGMKAMDIDLSSFVIPKELLAHCRYGIYASFCKSNASGVIN